MKEHGRPLEFLAAVILALALVDGWHGQFLTIATLFSVLQIFATGGLVALGLGLCMMMREFDLSVVGNFGMAGCIAVLSGGVHPMLGLALALTAGLVVGVVQGTIVVWLRLASVGVSLGGLLVTVGIAYVLTEQKSIPYDNIDVALALDNRIAGIFSIRSLIALSVFVLAALVVGLTRIGRDMIAAGSDRRAAAIAGVNVASLVIGVFGFSGLMAALSGVLLSYSLASASPTGLGDVLVPAVTAAILGGVSLAGGTGRPLGIASGVMTLAVLRAGFNAVAAPPWVNDVAMGGILLAVAILDGPYLMRRLRWL